MGRRRLLLFVPILVGLVAAPAVWRIGEVREGRRLLATGQTIPVDPAAVLLPARGLDLAVSADGRWAYAKTTRGVSKVDLSNGRAVTEWRSPHGMSMCGIDVGEAGVVVTDAQRSLVLLDPDTLVAKRTVDLGTAAVGGPAYPCGVRLEAGTAYVALNRANELAIVDLVTGSMRRIPVGLAPYGVAVDRDRVFVSFWGRVPEPGAEHATSAGVEVETDERGAATGGVLVQLDLQGAETRRWKVGAQPTEITVDGDDAYVACSNDDAVWRARPDGTASANRLDGLPGAAPSSMILDGDRAWVALSGENRIQAFDLKSGRSLGSIETGWYPVAVRKAGGRLIVADAKGLGGPTRNPGELVGAVHQIDTATLRRAPKPTVARSARLPLKHVVYIIKENRTYDQVLGDLPQGKGDPSLTMYGREVTPNHHALAEQFVLLDNFACNGSVSTDGHAWAIEGQATTFYERSFGGWTRAYPFGGDEPVAVSTGGHLWDAVLAAGRTFRNYGEFMYANDAKSFAENYRLWKAGERVPFAASIGVKRVRAYTSPDYPGWNLDIPDGYRADIFLREFQRMVADGSMPDLMTLYLPQDHTSGDRPGAATPRAHVADNDYAVGRIVEAISRSPFWKDTVVFVLEDDPQAGLDSVDGHRSLCLIASPYTRRGMVDSTFFNQTSVLRTICDIMGAKPYTRFIAASPSMNGLFGKKADLRPYEALPPTVALNELNPPKRNAAKLDLSGPDATDDEVMDHVLWSMAFPHRAFPHLASSHGTSRRDPDDDDER